MLQVTLIGNLGGNAEIKAADGREFVTFRVAHNESYKDAGGNRVDRTQWIDCTMSCDNGRPAVLPYLVAGTMVCVMGSMSTRVYSSEKDRCMKAGVTIHVQRLELLGGQSDVVPRRLYDKDGVQVDVTKFYFVPVKGCTLMDPRGRLYNVDKKGWVSPQNPAPEAADNSSNAQGDGTQGN